MRSPMVPLPLPLLLLLTLVDLLPLAVVETVVLEEATEGDRVATFKPFTKVFF